MCKVYCVKVPVKFLRMFHMYLKSRVCYPNVCNSSFVFVLCNILYMFSTSCAVISVVSFDYMKGREKIRL